MPVIPYSISRSLRDETLWLVSFLCPLFSLLTPVLFSGFRRLVAGAGALPSRSRAREPSRQACRLTFPLGRQAREAHAWPLSPGLLPQASRDSSGEYGSTSDWRLPGPDAVVPR